MSDRDRVVVVNQTRTPQVSGSSARGTHQRQEFEQTVHPHLYKKCREEERRRKNERGEEETVKKKKINSRGEDLKGGAEEKDGRNAKEEERGDARKKASGWNAGYREAAIGCFDSLSLLP